MNVVFQVKKRRRRIERWREDPQMTPNKNSLEERHCKVCNKEGKRVLPVTVATHLDAKYWSKITDTFFFCFTEECPVIYFDNYNDTYFTKDKVKTRFGLKEKESPRPICYCLRVTEEMIEDEILNKGCCFSLEDIEYYTKAGTGKWCLTTNPSGKCCREYLPKIVNKYLAIAKEKGVKSELEKIKSIIVEEEPVKEVEIEIRGMTCESCVASVKSVIEHFGGTNVSASLEKGNARFLISISKSVEEVIEKINETGFVTRIKDIKRVMR